MSDYEDNHLISIRINQTNYSRVHNFNHAMKLISDTVLFCMDLI